MPAYNFDKNPDLENIYSNVLALEEFVKSAKPGFKNIVDIEKMLQVGAALGHFFGFSGLDGVDLSQLTSNGDLISTYNTVVRVAVNDFPDEEFEHYALKNTDIIDWDDINPKISEPKLQEYIDREIKLYVEEGVSQEVAETQTMDNLEYVCGQLYNYTRNWLDAAQDFLILAEQELGMV